MVEQKFQIVTPESMEDEFASRQPRKSASKSIFSNQGTLRSGTANSGSLSRTNREIEDQDKRSAATVKRLKTAILLFFSLTAVGVAAAFFIYRDYNQKSNATAFKARFTEDANNMLASIGANIDSTLGATDAFAISMLSHAKATNQTYPFVTIDDFAVGAGKLLKNSRSKYITTYQVVEKDQRKEWEEYSASHNYWVDQSIMTQSRDRTYFGPNVNEEWLEENYSGHYNLIHDFDEVVYYGNSTDGVDHDGPYLPIWQCSPVIPFDPIYNWDLSTNYASERAINGLKESHMVTFTEPYMINWPDDLELQAENEACAEWFSNYLEPDEEANAPVFDIYYPLILEAVNNVHHHEEDYSGENYMDSGYKKEENTLGAILALSIYWRDALENLLPRGSAGVVAVFENGCESPPFAYEITGPVPKYLGVGSFNSSFTGDDDLRIVANLTDVWSYGIANSTYTGIPINDNICPYTITVYPAEMALEQFMQTTDNTVYVVLVLVLSVAVLAIAFTLLFFFLYDRLVQNEIKSKISLLDAKRNFVRFVSHEVRTPLNTVCMGLGLINQEFDIRKNQMRKKSTPKDDASGATQEDFERWHTLTQEVAQNADVAVGVLNDLLNIDKIQMGAFKLEMEVLPILEIIEQTTAEFTMMAAKQDTKLKLSLSSLAKSKEEESASTPTHTSMLRPSVLNQKLIGDDQRIRQVLRNLLSNAIKFSKNRSVTVKVYMRDVPSNRTSTKNIAKPTKEFKMMDGTRKSFVSSGQLVVDVVDTGVGMTQTQLETVFDVGTQFNANKLQSGGGSGLGLAFAKAIAEQHGGSLRAFSGGRDRGTTFRLDIPLHLDEKTSLSSETTTTSSNQKRLDSSDESEECELGTSGRTRGDDLEPMQILVVDDAPMNRKLLTRLLEMNGHTCKQAENGQELIDMVRENLIHYDCILVDYEMPVMNGPEACKGVREMGYTGFVVGVTGNLLPEDVGYFMDCGADAVLPKPFKYKELENLLIERGMFDTL